MKNARRILSIIALCALMFLMTACGGGQSFPHGKIGGSSYTSEFLGFKAKFGSEWELYSDSQTAQYNKMSDMSESSIKSQFDKVGIVYDMVAAKPDGSSVNICVQDTKKTGKMKEEDYFTTGLELIKKTLESTSGAKVSLKADSVNFLGKATRCIKVQMSLNGVTVHMIQIPVFKGDYIASITFGSVNESDLPAFLAMFSAA